MSGRYGYTPEGAEQSLYSHCRKNNNMKLYSKVCNTAWRRRISKDEAYRILMRIPKEEHPKEWYIGGIKISVLNYAKRGENKYQIVSGGEYIGFNDRKPFIDWIERNV